MVRTAVVFTMDTVFGFFSPAEPSPPRRACRSPSDASGAHSCSSPHELEVDLKRRATQAFFGPTLRLAREKLLMIDELTGWWPDQGEAGLGVMRAIKHIDPTAWFFQAHFFQDPVQPGSLGLEALLQVLQAAMIQKGLHQGIDAPRFEAVALSQDFTWKYRGQVLTHNTCVTATVELTQVTRDAHGPLALATGSLWVDGMRIYQGTTFGMRVVSGGAKKERTALSTPSGTTGTAAEDEDPDPAALAESDLSITLETDPWLLDHCPTHTAPALPMMSVLDLMAHAAMEAAGEGWHLHRVEHLRLGKWLVVGPEGLKLRTKAVRGQEAGRWEMTLSLWWEAPRREFSRFDPVASCTVWLGHKEQSGTQIPRIELGGTVPEAENRYDSGALFHGPALQVLRTVEQGIGGAAGQIDLSAAMTVRHHVISPALLDGALQVIPHDAIESWWPGHPGGVIAYPHEVESLEVFGPTPTGAHLCRSVVSFVSGEGRFARFVIQIFEQNRLFAQMNLTEVLLPKGPLGRL